MTQSVKKEQELFHTLTPERVITPVEKALGIRCTNLCRPLNSYINRVFELESEDGRGLVAKFYRPGRWSAAALQDEHDFLHDLLQEEIPVVAPLVHGDGATLGTFKGVHFAVFPKKGGRSFDEFSDNQWLQLGRLLGRTHLVGARRQPLDRIIMAPESSTRQQLDYLLSGGFLPADLQAGFRGLVDELIAETAPLFNGMENIRIHGDCHFSNLIFRPEESFFLIDFDDMAVGPAVQDLWMLLPGRLADSLMEVDLFLEGYETFRPFDRRSFRLIEPLRAMRFVHFCSWCARQVAEDGESRAMPEFGSRHYWQQEINDLADQLVQIRTMPALSGKSSYP
jgi:Ser/Thr protein kinase RdoA (MazF antagonist)